MSVTNRFAEATYNYLVICNSGVERVINIPAGASCVSIGSNLPVPVHVRFGAGATIPDPIVEKLDGDGPIMVPSYDPIGPFAVAEGDEIHLRLSTAMATAYSTPQVEVYLRWGNDDLARHSTVAG